MQSFIADEMGRHFECFANRRKLWKQEDELYMSLKQTDVFEDQLTVQDENQISVSVDGILIKHFKCDFSSCFLVLLSDYLYSPCRAWSRVKGPCRHNTETTLRLWYPLAVFDFERFYEAQNDIFRKFFSLDLIFSPATMLNRFCQLALTARRIGKMIRYFLFLSLSNVPCI